MSDTTKLMVDELYQDRLETLLSVDDLVEEVVGTLEVDHTISNIAIHCDYRQEDYLIAPTSSTTAIMVSIIILLNIYQLHVKTDPKV